MTKNVKIIVGVVVLILVLGVGSIVGLAIDHMPVEPVSEVPQDELDKQRELAAQYSEEEAKIREQYLDNEENIQYYAYLNINTAEEELKPIILTARNIIIHRYSWVADGMNGKILDREKNIKEEIPEFSDLFPEDWEMPVSVAKDVDLSYYTAPNK